MGVIRGQGHHAFRDFWGGKIYVRLSADNTRYATAEIAMVRFLSRDQAAHGYSRRGNFGGSVFRCVL